MKHNEHPVFLDQMAERFRREIFAYIQTKVGDRAAAEDLTQETFLKVQNSLSKGTEPEHFRGWIYTIARNSVVDFMNQRRRFWHLMRHGTLPRSNRRKSAMQMTANFANASFLTLSR